MENEEDEPQELLEVGPRVHLAQYLVNNYWKKASTQRHLSLTCSSGEFLLILTTMMTLSLLDSQTKKMSLNRLTAWNSFFWWTSRQEAKQENLSPIYCHQKSDVWIQNLNSCKYFCVPVQAICARSQQITLRSEHLQQGWKGRSGKGEQRLSWLPTARWIAIC